MVKGQGKDRQRARMLGRAEKLFFSSPFVLILSRAYKKDLGVLSVGTNGGSESSAFPGTLGLLRQIAMAIYGESGLSLRHEASTCPLQPFLLLMKPSKEHTACKKMTSPGA